MARPLKSLNMSEVREHYLRRVMVSKKLRTLITDDGARATGAYVNLALGIAQAEGNYSAWEHGLGSKILAERTAAAVRSLAIQLPTFETPELMLDAIYRAAIPNLKVSVGSEIAMMLCPSRFWVANSRTVWAHLLVKHGFNYEIANEALRLYRVEDQNSKMTYDIWKAICVEMRGSVSTLATLGREESEKQSIKPGKRQNLWFDALANALYEQRAG